MECVLYLFKVNGNVVTQYEIKYRYLVGVSCFVVILYLKKKIDGQIQVTCADLEN